MFFFYIYSTVIMCVNNPRVYPHIHNQCNHTNHVESESEWRDGGEKALIRIRAQGETRINTGFKQHALRAILQHMGLKVAPAQRSSPGPMAALLGTRGPHQQSAPEAPRVPCIYTPLSTNTDT